MDLYSLLKAAFIIFIVDIFWLATAGIYARKMTELIQGSPIKIRFLSGIIVYLFLAYMLLETKSSKQAFMYGVSIYAVYDFTSYAILDKYDWRMAVADSLWGGVLFVVSRHLFNTF